MAKQIRQFDRHIESVTAALEVLDCFLVSSRLGIKDIVDMTGMTRNRVTRILGTLAHKGYVMAGEEDGVFTPGPKSRSLGKVFEAGDNLVVLVRSVLRRLALATGESATFYIREGHERVVLAREEGTNSIRFAVAVGQRMELYAGAAGKVLLAYAPPQERAIILEKKKLAEGSSNITADQALLEQEINKVHSTGYAVSKGERNPDAFSIAVPVFERGDDIIGALALAGPLSRLKDMEIERDYVDEVLRAAQDLSANFNSNSTA